MARIRSKKNSSRKELITLAAARLFREKGFSATGMRDLAGDVGVEAASLYNHISSKAELLQEICFRIANTFTTQLNELEANDTMSSIEKIEQVIRFHIRMWVDRIDEVLVANNESKYLDEPYLTTFYNERRIYVRRLEMIIEDGIKKKQIRKIQPYAVVLLLLSAVRGIEFWHRTKKNISAAELEDSMVVNIINGLAAQ
ncbi:TetR/AcrR family transcriptional regulator [Pollutibacter soli]|uniref:TetR/AcrR family transcriptional regulator n=1 Tax=Pollutibacter soli TaxID=3034157 RepID=UPI0030140897